MNHTAPSDLSSHPLVVLKFGGTSVAQRARWENIASIAQTRLADQERPFIVCSAISGISNLLEKLLHQAPENRHSETLKTILERHRQLAKELDLDADTLLEEHFAILERLSLGASLTGEVSPRLHAQVMAQGELMSTRLGAAFLNAMGVSTQWIDARDALRAEHHAHLTERRLYTSATCVHERDTDLTDRIASETSSVLLTQGFIARNPQGHTVLLGRGGSDTSAAYFAAKLGAARCEIWTDVPGMYTANPRDIPNARLLRRLGYDEAQEIASTGAKVLHPRCIPPVRNADISLHICCTSRPEIQGTVISSKTPSTAAQVKAISVKSDLVLISMDTPGMWQQVGFLADIFTQFKDHGLSIDLVSTSEMNITVSLDPASNDLSEDALRPLLSNLNTICKARTIRPCAAVSLVGKNIRAILHKLGPALEAFEEQAIHLVSQAASDLNLSFVVHEDQAERLVRKLHWLLFQEARANATFGPTWDTLFGTPKTPALTPHTYTPWWHAHREALLTSFRDQTPRYVYCAQTLKHTAQALSSMTHVDRVFYAMKANSNPQILRIFHALGLSFECVSPGEIKTLLELFPDLSRDRILFTPNFAPRSEYAFALDLGVHLNLDNLHPLKYWPELFEDRDIFVRIDPGQGKGHHEFVKTAGKTSKFGISLEQLDDLEHLSTKARANIVGLHVHSGSGVFTPDEWSQNALLLAKLSTRFPKVRTLDLGGGLGVPYKPSQPELDLDALNASLLPIRTAFPQLSIWIEPGRYLVARAGILLASVTQLKRKGDIHYVGLNVGMNSLIRPALYGAFHPIHNLSKLGQPNTFTANIVGPICESGDTLGYQRRLPETDEGDIFLIDIAGAYGHAMASQYNQRPPAQELIFPPTI